MERNAALRRVWREHRVHGGCVQAVQEAGEEGVVDPAVGVTLTPDQQRLER